ncbi:pilin [bacterium]|nr:pilin [bacterium]
MIKILGSLRKNETGFTLIEVMVVIIMVGILAAIAVPIYTNYVYRARTSEAVSTLGAVKTYVLERRNATGRWPTVDEIRAEFRGFNELYYFNNSTIRLIESGDRLAVRLEASANFDAPSSITEQWVQLDIDLNGNDANMGWSGGIVTSYASHLKGCTSPLT